MASSRWASWEFLFFYAYTVFFYWKVIQRAVLLSNQYAAAAFSIHSTWLFDYPGAFRGLTRGWINGRLVDVNDSQWRSFRENIPVLGAVMAVLAIASWAVRVAASRAHRWHQPKHEPGGIAGRSSIGALTVYWLIAGVLYVGYLHGACVLFLLAIATANYYLVKIAGDPTRPAQTPSCPKCMRASIPAKLVHSPSSALIHFLRSPPHSLSCASHQLARALSATVPFPALLFCFNCVTYYLVRRFDGFRFASLGPALPGMGLDLAFLDNHRGAFRWQVRIKSQCCRMVRWYGLLTR